jgi:surface antigen
MLAGIGSQTVVPFAAANLIPVDNIDTQTIKRDSRQMSLAYRPSLDLSTFKVGQTKSPVSNSTIAAAQAGNSYMAGTCAAYVWQRVTDLGYSLPPFLGDAGQWPYSGPAQGLKISQYPQPGFVVMFAGGQFGAWGPGHVGVVEKVNADGSFLISEMTTGAFSQNRTFSADDAKVLKFLVPGNYSN